MTPPTLIRGIRGKLIVAFSTLVACIAGFVLVFFPWRLERQAMRATVSKAAAVRDMTAYSLGAGLYFGDTTAVREVLTGAARAEGVSFLIVRDTAGRVVASRSSDGPIRADQILDDHVASDGLTYVTSHDVEGGGGRKIGTLSVGISLAPLRAEVANAHRIGALVGILIVAIGVLVVFAISELVTRPLTAVAKTVDRIAGGDLTSRAAETDDVEITRLVRAFNRMVDALVGTQAELATMNEELERRVDCRTAELTAAVEEHRQSKMALALSEIEARRTSQLLQSLIDVAPQAIVATDLDWRITRWNHAAERLFGWSVDEVLGKALPFVPSDQISDARGRQAAVAAGGTTGPVEISRARKDGTRISVLLSAGVLRDQEQRPAGYIGFFTDLTARKQLEEQLRQSQKMDAMGRLAGGVAHDFNNLLTVITACSELLLLDDQTTDQRAQLEQIAGAAARAAALTRQLLTFTRQQIVQPRSVDVSTVARGLEPMLRRVLRENIRFDTKLDPTVGVVKADPTQLEQVLMNLVINASEAMPQGGVLTVATRRVHSRNAEATISADLASGWHSVLVVSDTGIGMDTQTLSRIFEPFFTTKEIGKGTGLGLATTYGIVSELGGRINVQSRLGAGSTFAVYIPEAIDDVGVAHSESQPSAETAEPNEPATILLVEDEASVRRVVRRGLERAGYTVLEASDGESGLAVAMEHDGEIGAVVTDMMMPGMTGREFATRLAERYPHLGVVYVSGYTETFADEEPMTDARHAFVQKPFTSDQLTAAIESVRGVVETAA